MPSPSISVFYVNLGLGVNSCHYITASVPHTLGPLVTAKWLILEFIFAKNQHYYTDIFSGRRRTSTLISASYSADMTGEIHQIFVTKQGLSALK